MFGLAFRSALWEDLIFSETDVPLSRLRKLFFSDYGNAAKLERCSLDGSERSRIVQTGIEQPTALTLDLVKKLVYWADVYLDFIAVVDYGGGNRQTIIRGNSVSNKIYNVRYTMIKMFKR